MTDGHNTPDDPTGKEPASPAEKSLLASLLKLPGLVAISFYMMLLAAVTVVYVMQHHTAVLYLVFPIFFIAGALGLLLLLRWGWALTLAAMALSSATFLYRFSTEHSFAALLQGLLNLVFFFYLVRTDVREKLR